MISFNSVTLFPRASHAATVLLFRRDDLFMKNEDGSMLLIQLVSLTQLRQLITTFSILRTANYNFGVC